MLIVGTLTMMGLYSIPLTFIAIASVTLYILLRLSVYRQVRDARTEQIIHAAKQQTHFMETIRGIQSVRLFSKSQERHSGWMNFLTEEFNSLIRIQRLDIFHSTSNTLLFGVERIVVIWLAALAVTRGAFTIGMLFAFLAYKDQFSRRIASLVDNLFELKMLRLHGERVADIVLSEVEQRHDNHYETNMRSITPFIEITNLSFRYSPSDPWILRNLNLRIEAGDCVAIAGASGCGKTTLIKLLLGLLPPTEGSIHVGGINIEKLGLTTFREIIGTVMQDDTLFSGTIGDNISFFDPLADQRRVEVAAKLAAIHDEIATMPMGYNSLVGDVGTGLSGGQKQRILLARALYKLPSILVLDEATSHLDVTNERIVNNAVKAMHLTRVVVAHRPETIAMANRVIVLESGMVARDLIRDTNAKIAEAS